MREAAAVAAEAADARAMIVLPVTTTGRLQQPWTQGLFSCVSALPRKTIDLQTGPAQSACNPPARQRGTLTCRLVGSQPRPGGLYPDGANEGSRQIRCKRKLNAENHQSSDTLDPNKKAVKEKGREKNPPPCNKRSPRGCSCGKHDEVMQPGSPVWNRILPTTYARCASGAPPLARHHS